MVEQAKGITSTRVAIPTALDTAPVKPQDGKPGATAAAPTATDGVDSAKPQAPTGGTTSLEQRVQELEGQLAQERTARVEKEKKEADEAKKPTFFRTLMEIFDLFNRFFNPLWNIACALFRIVRIGYDLITGKEVDWKKEGIKLAAEIGGAALQICMPGTGAIIGGALSAGVEGYMNWKYDESEYMGGANKLTDKADIQYGIRHAAEKVAGVAQDAYSGAKKLVTGKDDAPAKDDGVKPLTATEVAV